MHRDDKPLPGVPMTPLLPPAPGAAGPAGTLGLLAAAPVLGLRPVRRGGRKFAFGFQPTRESSLAPGAAVAEGWQLLADLGSSGLLRGPKGGNSCCSSWKLD